MSISFKERNPQRELHHSSLSQQGAIYVTEKEEEEDLVDEEEAISPVTIVDS